MTSFQTLFHWVLSRLELCRPPEDKGVTPGRDTICDKTNHYVCMCVYGLCFIGSSPLHWAGSSTVSAWACNYNLLFILEKNITFKLFIVLTMIVEGMSDPPPVIYFDFKCIIIIIIYIIIVIIS